MKQKTLKLLAAAAAVAILAGLGWFANVFIGNPVSRALAARTAETHLAEVYPGHDFYIDGLNYSFKDTGYHAHIKSPSSEDSSFTLFLSMTGRLVYDDYDYRVTERNNTAERLSMAYRALADTVLESPSFPYESHIAFGNLEFWSDQEADIVQEYPYAIRTSTLELDKVYNIAALGAEAGRLVLYLYHDPADIDAEHMAAVLLDVKSRFDDAGAPFYAVDLVLQPFQTEEGPPAQNVQMEVLSFLYRDIYEDGLVDRVRAADQAARAYRAEQDANRKDLQAAEST